MIWLICKNELRINCLNLRLPLILIVAVAFTAVTTVISCNDFRERAKEYHARRDHHKTSPVYLHADRPPNPLSIFCAGVFPKTPLSVQTPKLPYFGMETKVTEHPTDNILFAQLQYPDVSFVLAVVIGLGVILFTYDSICGEKERGTLKLAFSNNIRRYQLLLGKFLAGALGLSAIVLVVWLLSTLLATKESFIYLKASDFGLLMLAVLSSFLYVFVFLAVAMLVSSLVGSSRIALVCCISFWLFACLLAPFFGPIVAKMTRKIPLYQEFVLSRHALLNQETKDTIEVYREKRVENSMQAAELILEAINKVGVDWSKLNEQLITEYQRKVNGQTNLSHLICSATPPLAFQFALSEICGTSITSQRYFEEQSKDWANAYAANIWKEHCHNIESAMQVFTLETSQPDIKPFPIRSRLKHWVGYLAYMVILAMFCFALTFVRFVRYDVR